MFDAMKHILFVAYLLLFYISSAQVGIGTESPNNSAELHVNSNSKGVLLPRLSTLQMNAIISPTDGLLLYNIDDNVFYYYNGSMAKWIPTNIKAYSFISDNDGDTKIVVDESGDGSKNSIHFYANADGNSTADGNSDKVGELISSLFNLSNEQLSYGISNTPILSLLSNNIFFSDIAPSAFGTGDNNIIAGIGSGASITTGNNNVLLGASAGQNISSGSSNILIGANAGFGNGASLLTGKSNIGIGYNSLSVIESSANSNIAIGNNAGNMVTSGTNNILIGNNAGSNITTGSNNILIGSSMLPIQNTNDSLNIGNVISSSNAYDIDNNVTFANAYTFPANSGAIVGETFVLQSGDTLAWSDKNIDQSEPNLTVAGASTDMKPFSRLAATKVFLSNGNTFFVPVTAMSNGSITKLTTFIANSLGSDYTITMSLMTIYCTDVGDIEDTIAYIGNSYAGAEYYFEGTVTVPAGESGFFTVDFYNGDHSSNVASDRIPDGQPDQRAFSVSVGQKYAIAVHASEAAVLFLENSDNQNKGWKIKPCVDTDGEGCDYEEIEFINELIWARAH